VKELRESQQNVAARLLLAFANPDARHYRLTDAQVAEVERAKQDVREESRHGCRNGRCVASIWGMTLRYIARARAHLLAIHEYINERNPAAASRVGARKHETADVLRSFPYCGRPRRSANTRE
jgi:hypothetical protein